ncbi:MAG: hypothetical protein A2061_00040 [Gallionellales bacterium GWA2_59_43]|nr:MAG: hypothetical protein A2061_00040 [Gallionellales bacterium GWA2_59_43]
MEMYSRKFSVSKRFIALSWSGSYYCRATLYHDRASIFVVFAAGQRDPQPRRGRFVSVEGLTEVHSDHSAVKVAGLCERDCASSGFKAMLIKSTDSAGHALQSA